MRWNQRKRRDGDSDSDSGGGWVHKDNGGWVEMDDGGDGAGDGRGARITQIRERDREGERLSTHSLRSLVDNQQALSTRKTRKDRSIDIIGSHRRNDWLIGRLNPPHKFPLVKLFLWILWQFRSVDFILCQFLTFVWEATWFLHASQLCARPKVNYPATYPGRTSI